MFGGLTEAELDIVRPHLDEKKFPKGTCVLRQGDPNNTVYFIVEGTVCIQKHPENGTETEREITTLHTGDSFGEMELIDIQSCAASVICQTDTTIVTLSNKDLYQLSKTHLMIYTMIILNLARDISRRLRATDELLAIASSKKVQAYRNRKPT